MKIIFMGTPQLVVPLLEEIHLNHQVCLVVTQPDRPKGRSKKPVASPVKEKATELDIPLLQPTDLNDDSFYNAINKENADLIFVVAFSILPKKIFTLPRLGSVNLHFALLPKYKGSAPVQWAIINGEKETGISFFSLNEKMDAGDILLQKSTPIETKDNYQTLSDKLIKLGKEQLSFLFENIVELIENANSQNKEVTSLAPKLKKENGKINWTKSNEEINCQIRGMSLYPITYSTTNTGLKIRVHQAEIYEDNKPTKTPGTIEKIEEKLIVHCGNRKLALKLIQPEGKKIMDSQSFFNGYKNNTHFLIS